MYNMHVDEFLSRSRVMRFLQSCRIALRKRARERERARDRYRIYEYDVLYRMGGVAKWVGFGAGGNLRAYILYTFY